MAFTAVRKNLSEKDQLTVLHKSIIQIAQKLRKKNRILDVQTLFEKCCKELPNPEPEIDRAIRELYQKNYLVEGKILFKNGIYHLDSPLTISYAIFNIVLEGESWPEDLASSSATWRGVVLEKDFNGDLLTITGPTQYSLYAQFEIKNLGFSRLGLILYWK